MFPSQPLTNISHSSELDMTGRLCPDIGQILTSMLHKLSRDSEGPTTDAKTLAPIVCDRDLT